MTEVSPSTPGTGATAIIERRDLDGLLAAICDQGYQLVGPTVHDGAIVYRQACALGSKPARAP